ncbi:MAG: alpha-2-macroglobulin family protein, partial [Myxococcota bacterium]
MEVSSSGLYLRGATQARTTYRIVLSPALTDVFGQALGETESLSLEVGPAPPLLTAPGRDLVRLLRGVDAVPFLVAGAESLEVEVRQVKPSDWPAYAKHHRGGMRTPLPGKITFEGQVPVMGDPDRATELSIDVSSALNDGMGHAIVSVKHPGAEHRYPPTVWVAVSNVLLDAWSDSESDLYVLASDPSGAPLVGREIRMGAGGASATTNAEGLARLPLLPERPSRDPWLESKDAAFLPGAAYGGGEVFARRAPGEPRASFLVLDDRGLYRPGETAHLKGFVRRFIADKLETPKAGLQVKARVRGPRGNEWAAKEATLSRYGSFTLDIDVPKDANLGRAHVEIEVPSLGRRARTRHLLRIEEFRRPVFDVSVQLDAPPHVIGEPLSAVARAEAYAGGALSGTPVRWQVHEATAHYAPPGWDGWRFGAESPWWWSFRLNFPRAGSDGATYRVEDVTDASGRSTLKLVPREPKKNLPVSLSVGVEVEDVDRRSVRAQAQALVLPAERTIGLRLEDVFLPAGAPLDLEWVAVDLDGRPSSGSAVSLSLFSRPGYGPVEDEPETSAPLATISALSGTGPDSARFAAPEAPGRYLVRAEVEDASGRRSRTELFAYWSGGADRSPSHVERESLELVPDKERYAVGETATIEVRSPLPEARGAWMVMADGLVRFEPLSLKGGSAQLRIPVTRSMAPDPFVEVWLAGSDPNPVELAGMIPLVVGIDEDKLTVSVRPPAETSPGADTVIELEVKDAQGRPVEGAEITLAVADEAVLALAKRPWPEPLEALIPDRLGYIHELHSRSKLVLVAPSEVSANLETLKLGSPPEAAEMMMRSAGAAPGAAGRDPIDLREDLRPLAYFNPGLITDGEGRVQARFQLPDDLTRWRARAVAASGAQFGRGEAAFVARKPISIEPALPRFLSFGDAPELSFVVANRSDAPQPIELAVTTQ